ncbi:hypothetical protein F1559_001187 [Cyanidiococcus yangmingshanensis]|uniref:3'-5' exonuclease domain-containing protein n=1 Tax=Cyanidiococcus yangmingshanensis TaxID=2690220 RepID=A0A7J7IEX0_9RHOD|nr:hypothetical protein F1559_001187 [Cyanidiococcus yangmingshanensis]
MQQQYQLTANALMDWRLRLAPVDEVAQAYRFADPRVLVKIARRWRISTLDVSAVEAAMMLFHACLERKRWRAAVEWLNELSRLALATDSLLAKKRAILLEVLIKQQQWSLAAQCAQDWKDAEHLEELRWLEAQEVLRTPMTRGSKTATGSLVPFQVSERTYTAPECALDLDSIEPSLGEATLGDSEKGHGISSPTLAMLRLPANVRVHWVATVTAASHLEQFVRAILASETATLSRPRNVNESRCVGLDVEWKPVRTAGLEPRCALLQVAFLKDVFLVDLLRLDLDRLFASQLNEALQLLFRSPDILKVGFGFSADLARLRRSYRYLSCLDVIVSLRDLDRINWEDSGGFCATLATRVGRTNVRRRGRLTVGLAQLVEALLGRWINKCPRCSNWEARPLSPVQIEYAALDAWVLLMLLERMPAAAGRRVGATRRPLHDTNLGTPSSEMTLSMMDHDMSAVVHMAALERVCKALSAHDRWRGRPVYRFNNVLYAGPFCPLVRPTASAATPDLRRVDDAAFALGVADHRIGKCIALVAAEQRPLLVVMAGQRRAPLRRIARMMDLPCSALRFATPLELVTIFGFAPGSVSPLGLLNEYSDGERVGHAPMLTFMDDALRAEETTEPWCQSRNGLVFVSAGSPESMMAISAVDLQYYRRALWLSVLPKTNAFIKRTWDLAGAAARSAQAPWGTRWMRSYFEDCRQGRFVVDSTMGGLVRRLRALGMDVLHTPEKNVELLFGLAWMPEDGAQTLSASKPRVILTRDAEILSRATRYGVPCYYVAAMQTGQQAQEVLETFQLFPDSQNFLARCVQCNCARFEQRTRDEVRPYLPARTVESFQTFYECAQCHQLYWKGAHFERATQQLAEMVHRLRLRSHESRVP